MSCVVCGHPKGLVDLISRLNTHTRFLSVHVFLLCTVDPPVTAIRGSVLRELIDN